MTELKTLVGIVGKSLWAFWLCSTRVALIGWMAPSSILP